MDFELSKRVALVAAGSQGLGKACALGLAREGARVSICARNEEILQATAAQIRKETGAQVLARKADMSVLGDIQDFVKATYEEFGNIDIAVTNAGGPPKGVVMSVTEEQWLTGLNLNLLSAIRLSQAVAPYMQKQKWGRIINIISTSVKEPFNGLVLSNVMRAGVVAFAKTMSNELGPDNVLVNNVCPGSIWTARSEASSRSQAERAGISLEEAVDRFNQTIPLRRQGQPEELANLVVFLASERASYITGATIQVDGGLIKSLM